MKKLFIALVVLVALAGLAVATMDFAGDLVVREAGSAVKEYLGADLAVAGIKGNPVKGFSMQGVSLKKDGQPLFSAKFLDVSLNLASLLSKSPKLSLLSVGGVEIDADRLAAQVAQLKFEGGGGGEIPIETVRFVESVVVSKWARADITKLGLSFKGKEILADVDMAVNKVPVKGSTTALLDGENVDIRSLAMNVGKGSVSASGKVAPSLAVSGNLKELDLKELISFWPVVSAEGFDGAVSLSFRGDGEWNAPALAGDMEYAGKSLLGYPVESVKAKWTLGRDKLSVEGLDARVLGMPLAGGMSLGFAAGKAPVVDLSLSGSGIKLAELKKVYPDIGDVSGEVDKFTINLAGTMETLSGVIEFSAPKLGLMGYSVSESRAQVKLTPETATVSAKSQFEGAPITAQGSINEYMTAPKLNLTINVRSLNLTKIASSFPQLKELALQGGANADVWVKGTAAAPEVTVKVWSEKISAMKEAIESPTVMLSLKGETITISNAAAKWRGAAIAASGTVEGSEKLNITATLENIQPGAIAPFYPDIAQLKIKGAVTAKAVITGKPAAPKIDLTLSSGSLGLLDSVSFKNLKATTSLVGDPKALEKADIDLNISAASAAAEGIGLSDLALKLKKSGQKITILSAGAKSGAGSVSAAGAVALPAKAGEKGNLDLTVTIAKADLAFLAAAGGLGVPLAGTLDGSVALKGALDAPSLVLKASSPKISVAGMTATDLSAALSGTMKDMKIDDFKAKFGGGSLSAKGGVTLGATPAVTLDISGSDLDLAALVSGMPDAKELGIGGKLNVSFNGRFAGAAGKGQGSISSPAFTVMGLKGSNLSYPIALDGNSISSKGASLSFYGGTLRGGGALDIKTMKFSHTVELNGVDVNSVAQDFTGGLEGKIGGLAKGSASISGALEPKLAYSGKGSVTIGEGSITGFKAVQLLTALYRSGVRYSSVTAPFRLETGRFILEKGTKANAPQNDPLYKFLTAEGPIGPKGALNLQCAGNVNLQVLNALTGGAVGGLTAGSLEDALKGLLGGLQSGMEKADFRDISFTLKGTTEKPGVSNLKIAPGAQQPGQPAPTGQPAEPQDPKKKLEQMLIEQIVKPSKPAQPEQPQQMQPAQPDAPASSPTPAPTPTPEKKPEDIIKDKILESIFK
ncbi:MAG TPA: AsmA-like C-terminal domain-containing protein [Synergistales bacterium]|nr:AsmA-like C-terminal domain-containing protein [Synergistales bacterium]